MSGIHNVTAIFLALSLGLSVFAPVSAVVKDTDTDGLTDQSEVEVYLTDPANPDTDGDGTADGTEIIGGTNPLAPEYTSHTSERLLDVEPSLAWYLGRASGIVAFILLTIVVVNGLLMTTRLVFTLLPPALNYDMHRFFSHLAWIAVLGHIIAFFFDSYFRLSPAEAFIPFFLVRDYTSFLGYDLRFAIGIGIIAFYGIVMLVITSELKGRGISLKKWRVLHYMSFLTYLLFLGHGYFAGSDSREWWMLWLYGLSATLVISLTALRIWALVANKKSGLPTAPATTPKTPHLEA
mgnify:FL=1